MYLMYTTNNIKTRNLVIRLGVFTFGEAINEGISRFSLKSMLQNNEILKLAHGLYIYKNNPNISPEYLDFIIACKHFGKPSTISGLTSLYNYNLIEEIPRQIWLLVPAKKQNNNSLYRVIRTRREINIGVIEKDNYRISNIEKSVLDALIYSSKIGIDTAIGALIKSIKSKQTTLKKISNFASKVDEEDILKKYWSIINGAL